MTRATPALLALLALAACSRNDPLPPAGNAAEAACRAEAQSAPETRDAYRRLQTQNLTARRAVEADIALAERAAYLRCMRARGLAAPGGVEAVRPL